MSTHRTKHLGWLLLGLLLVGIVTFTVVHRHGVESTALNPEQPLTMAYDVWGRSISASEARDLQKTEEGRQLLNPANGAVAIDDALLKLGRDSFYREAFGNEIPLTEVTGMLSGPIGAADFAAALAALKGAGTTNLRVAVSRPQTIAGRQFRKGELIETGIDVVKGSITPLGIIIRPALSGVRIGITCAACHSTVDPVTKRLIHGAPNSDLNAGLLLALAPNSASFFAHGDVQDLRPFVKDPNRTVLTSTGSRVALPDPLALENAIDTALMKWPPGTFDSMLDLKGDPTQIPTSFTRDAYPYGWSGFAAAGPFHGLSSLNNNVHGLNSDPFTVMEAAPALFHLDKEVYLAILLQNSANSRYRFDPAKGEKPSEFLKRIDPTPRQPAMNETIALPTYPKGSLVSPDGLWVSPSGHRVWEQINAIAAYEDTLVPPAPASSITKANLERGREVFARRGCIQCHSGPSLTNHRIVPAEMIGTEPVRALALRGFEGTFAAPITYSFDQSVPLPSHPKIMRVPTDQIDPEQVNLAYAWGGTRGGYKVPSLIGLYWSAPYLHDSSIAVGPDPTKDFGIPGTFGRHVSPNPRNSLRALVDRALRAKVVAAIAASPALQDMNVRGAGHEFWVDSSSGFSSEDQEALLDYLLTYQRSGESK